MPLQGKPTTGIDLASVRQIRSLITELNKKGTTIFLTTHYIEEAERLCNRVAFIDKGKIVKIDSVEQLINESRETNTIKIQFEPVTYDKTRLLEKLSKKFPAIEYSLENDNTIRMVCIDKIDIAPVVTCLSAEGLFIYEARLIKPSL